MKKFLRKDNCGCKYRTRKTSASCLIAARLEEMALKKFFEHPAVLRDENGIIYGEEKKVFSTNYFNGVQRHNPGWIFTLPG